MKLFVFIVIVLFLFAHCDSNKSSDRSGYINIGNLRIYYTQEGKGRDLLFLHAGFQESGMWDEQVQAFKDKFRILRIDLPAHGKTEGKDTVTLISTILKQILDTLEIDKTSVAGLSMGSVVAQDFAIAHPEKVEKLILLAPGINGYDKHHPIDSVSMSWYAPMSLQLEIRDTNKAAEVFTRAWADGPYRDYDSSRPVSRYVLRTTDKNMRDHKLWGWPVLQKDPPAYDRIGELKMPVLIVHGDIDLPYIMVASKFLESKIKGSERVLIPGVAHMLNMEKVEEFNNVLLQFLEK